MQISSISYCMPTIFIKYMGPRPWIINTLSFVLRIAKINYEMRETSHHAFYNRNSINISNKALKYLGVVGE